MSSPSARIKALEEQARDHLKSGKKDYFEGNYAESLRELKECLETRLYVYGRDHYATKNVYFRMGHSYSANCQYEQAARHFGMAARIACMIQDSVEQSDILHWTLIRHGLTEDDRHAYQANVGLSICHEQQGDQHRRLGEWKQAIAAYQSAIELEQQCACTEPSVAFLHRKIQLVHLMHGQAQDIQWKDLDSINTKWEQKHKHFSMKVLETIRAGDVKFCEEDYPASIAEYQKAASLNCADDPRENIETVDCKLSETPITALYGVGTSETSSANCNETKELEETQIPSPARNTTETQPSPSTQEAPAVVGAESPVEESTEETKAAPMSTMTDTETSRSAEKDDSISEGQEQDEQTRPVLELKDSFPPSPGVEPTTDAHSGEGILERLERIDQRVETIELCCELLSKRKRECEDLVPGKKRKTETSSTVKFFMVANTLLTTAIVLLSFPTPSRPT